MTQGEMAFQLQVSRVTVNKWENGAAAVSAKQIPRILGLLPQTTPAPPADPGGGAAAMPQVAEVTPATPTTDAANLWETEEDD
jgi:transcriptional regulator with XRE-family HTH domain